MNRFALVIFFLFLTLESFVLISWNTIKEYIATPLFFFSSIGFIISLIVIIVAAVNRKKITDKSSDVKVKRIVMNTISSLLVFNILVFSFNSFVNLNITKDEIEDNFLGNYERFVVVAEYFVQQPGDFECYVVDNQIKIFQIDQNYKEKNIIIKDEVVKENLEYILKRLKYKRISKTENEVNYLLHPVHEVNGYDDGIAYIKGGFTENLPLMNQSYTKILDCWYYFFTGYV